MVCAYCYLFGIILFYKFQVPSKEFQTSPKYKSMSKDSEYEIDDIVKLIESIKSSGNFFSILLFFLTPNPNLKEKILTPKK